MPWRYRHKCHSIDDNCYACMREVTIKELAPDLLKMVKRLRKLLHNHSDFTKWILACVQQMG